MLPLAFTVNAPGCMPPAYCEPQVHSPHMESTEPPRRAAITGASTADIHGRLVSAHESRNLTLLAAHYVFLRVAWIFKTESVVVPIFLDTIAGAGWIRGCLPLLNRFGRSIPPLLYADTLRRCRRKKWVLLGTSLLLTVPFGLLSVIWFMLEDKHQPWLPPMFLLLYTLFFAIAGLNVLAFGTVQGKLIRADRRGCLQTASGLVASICAIGCAWFWMPRWLALPDGGFGYIFAVTALGFFAAGLWCVPLVEPADDHDTTARVRGHQVKSAWNVVRRDADFRGLALVGMSFITVQLLFPHFQALGRSRLSTSGFSVMVWVIAQNAGMGLFSMIAGLLADRFGNRLTLRCEMFAVAFTPLVAIVLTKANLGGRGGFYWITFFLLGLTPVTQRTLVNYALELADEADHPRYVSTLQVAIALPLFFAPMIGLLVDVLNFEIVFLVVSGLILVGGLMTFRLSEPRHQWSPAASLPDSAVDP